MTDEELQGVLRRLGHGERSFSVLRSSSHHRPLAAGEQIADRLEEEIALELLPPGAHLREAELAQRFGVSRGPVRDALRLLSGDSLVRLSPNRGAVVTDYAGTEMRQIADISSPMTLMVMQKVLGSISDASMKELAAAQARAGDLLERRDAVSFALALAGITIAQSGYAAGEIGEKVLQLLYRPSIRYTVAGLQRAEALPPAVASWRKLTAATLARDHVATCEAFLKLLRDIQLPVIRERYQNKTSDAKIL